jgi:hypothetical protein
MLKTPHRFSAPWLPTLTLAALTLGGPWTTNGQGINDGNGREWRQLTETTGLTWDQLTAALPRDGVTPASGMIGTRNVAGWVWANEAQVIELFSRWVPAILESPINSVGGYEFLAPALDFQSIFLPVYQIKGCPTYQPCFNYRLVSGWVAPDDGSAVPAAASVTSDTDAMIPGGWFAVEDPATTPTTPRGVFLWRPTGLHDGGIHANDDSGSPTTPLGGVAILVLANDWLAGARPNLNTVSLALVSPPISGIALDAAGNLRVDPGTPMGVYPLTYRICDLANPGRCDEAIATVTVRSFAIAAAADQGTVAFAAGGTPVSNVLINDRLGTNTATTQIVRLSQISSTTPGLALDTATGAVRVAPGTPHGIHTLTYRIQEAANPANSAQAVVTVRPNSIDAVNDSARGSSKTGGTVIPNVLANDWFRGIRANTADVRISLPAALPRGISLNLSTGAVIVAPKTASGTYVFRYRISELASPSNFDEATVTLDLSGRSR